MSKTLIFCPDFLFVIDHASTPRAKKNIAWTVRQNRLYKPRACHKGAASASERPPAGPEKLALPSGNGVLGQNFAMSRFVSHANFAFNNRP